MLDRTRHSGILSPEDIKDLSVCVIGCGAVGSLLVEALVKIGFEDITVYDFDTVEAHNLPNQGFYLQDLGKNKAEAVAARLENGLGIRVKAKPEKWTKEASGTYTLVLSAVDSISARQSIVDGIEAGAFGLPALYMDPRMGARFGVIYTVIGPTDAAQQNSGSSWDKYKGTLSGGDQAVSDVPCTEKTTIFCAYGLVALACAQLTEFCRGGEVSSEITADFVKLSVMTCM